MDLKLALKEYGLSENESKTYLALLKLGDSTAQMDAKHSSVPRTTTYNLLESLIQKGIVGTIVKDSKKHFQAGRPKVLLNKLDQKKKAIKEIIPELNSLASSVKEKPDVTVYEGIKGIRNILKDVLEERKTIYHYGDIISIQEVFLHAFPQFMKERIKRRIKIKILCKKEKSHKRLLKEAKNEHREFVFLPKDYKFKSSVFIFAKKVVIFNIHKEPYYAIMIKNKDFYETQKTFFKILWEARL